MATGYTPPGATCCCGGSGSPCPCDWPADLCVTDIVIGTAPFGTPFDPTVFDYAQTMRDAFAGTTWDATESTFPTPYRQWDATGTTDPGAWASGVSVTCGSGGAPAAAGIRVFLSRFAGTVANTTEFAPDAGQPADCTLPVTLTGLWVGEQRIGGVTAYQWQNAPGSVTISAGPCGGVMMAAPRLMTAAAPDARPLPAGAYRPPPPARPRICLYAERVEFLAGCSGFRCRHRCTSPDPGVRAALGDTDIVLPADECQTCLGYTAR